jgi:hypothetical protein
MMKILLAIMLILSSLVFAPEAHCTETLQQHRRRLFSKRNLTLFAIDAASRGIDAGQTCYHLGRGWREDVLPTQSCAGAVVGEIALSGIFHRLGWHRLEWLPPVTGAALSAAGTSESERR